MNGYAFPMRHDEHPKDPVEAAREGLEEIERKPHHPTTKHDKSVHGELPPRPIIETPGEAHRAGPLPNMKK